MPIYDLRNNTDSDFSIPLQNAIDNCSGIPSVILLPNNGLEHRLDMPVICDGDNIELRGDGHGVSKLKVNGSTGNHGLLLGFKRWPMNNDQWIVNTVQGSTFAYRTKGRSNLCFWADKWAFAAGNWSGIRQVTIDFWWVPLQNLGNTTTPLFGMDYREDIPGPWYVSVNMANNQYYFSYRLSTGATHSITWDAVNIVASSNYMVMLRLDLNTGSSTATVNNKIIGTTNTFSGSGTFIPNEVSPFNVNGYGVEANRPRSFDWLLYGLRLSRGIQSSGGTTFSRYFDTGKADSLAMIPFSDTFTSRPGASGRLIRSVCEGIHQHGVIVDSAHEVTFGTIAYNRLTDFELECSNGVGQSVSLGFLVYTNIKNCRFHGGFHGIGNINFGANYPVRVQNCLLDAIDASYYSYFQIGIMDNTDLGTGGRFQFRSHRSDNSVRNGFSQGDPITQYYFKCTESQRLYVDRFIANNENFPTPLYAAVFFENDLFTPGGAVDLSHCVWGWFGPQAVVLDVVCRAGTTVRNRALIRNNTAWNDSNGGPNAWLRRTNCLWDSHVLYGNQSVATIPSSIMDV